MDVTGLSLENVFQLQSKAFAEISEHAFAIDALAAGIAELDAALQLVIAEQSIDNQQTLVTTARQLAVVIEHGSKCDGS